MGDLVAPVFDLNNKSTFQHVDVKRYKSESASRKGEPLHIKSDLLF